MDMAYLGGFIDAGGSLCLKSPFLGRISIPNTNRKVLEEIKSFLGFSSLSAISSRKGHFGKKQMYELCITKSTRSDFAAKLAPYLFLKNKRLKEVFGVSAIFSPLSWSYVTGFYDGEGSLTFTSDHSGSHWFWILTNKCLELLTKIQGFIGCGQIKKHSTSKDCYQLYIRRQSDLERIGKEMLPYSIVKRDKLQQMLDYFGSHEWHPNYKMKHVTNEELAALYFEGFSIRQLAEVYGVKYNPMYERLIKSGVSLRPLGTNGTSVLAGSLEVT